MTIGIAPAFPLLLALLSPVTLPSRQKTAAPHDHAAAVDRRGDQVMGFDHAKTTHHFRLSPDGGSIEVFADDPADETSPDQIRAHLSHIAKMFAAGNFEAPMLIHGEVPPGVPVMKKLKARIRYEFDPTERGGRISISTKSSAARRGIHEFLRYQAAEHRTADSP